jgi:hypothetical protein
MFHEPLLLIAAFFSFFVLAIIYVRLDFAITKDEGSEAKLKVAGICEKIISHQVFHPFFVNLLRFSLVMSSFDTKDLIHV